MYISQLVIQHHYYKITTIYKQTCGRENGSINERELNLKVTNPYTNITEVILNNTSMIYY